MKVQLVDRGRTPAVHEVRITLTISETAILHNFVSAGLETFGGLARFFQTGDVAPPVLAGELARKLLAVLEESDRPI